MELKELHERYGQLMIQLEVIQNQVIECKRLIAEAMSKPPEPPKEEKKDGK